MGWLGTPKIVVSFMGRLFIIYIRRGICFAPVVALRGEAMLAIAAAVDPLPAAAVAAAPMVLIPIEFSRKLVVLPVVVGAAAPLVRGPWVVFKLLSIVVEVAWLVVATILILVGRIPVVVIFPLILGVAVSAEPASAAVLRLMRVFVFLLTCVVELVKRVVILFSRCLLFLHVILFQCSI